MKKITNNTMLGKLTILLNAVVLVCFIIAMLMLMKFDKTNKVVISQRGDYEKAYEEYVMAQHPLKQDSAEVAYYQYKIDTLQQRNVTKKDEKAALAKTIEDNKAILASVSANLKPGGHAVLSVSNYDYVLRIMATRTPRICTMWPTGRRTARLPICRMSPGSFPSTILSSPSLSSTRFVTTPTICWRTKALCPAIPTRLTTPVFTWASGGACFW